MALLWAATAQAAADVARGEEIVQGKCFICHGTHGDSASPAFPRLAGQNAADVARPLADYESGKCKSGTMPPMVEALSADDMRALGSHFARQATQGHAVDDMDLQIT